MDGVFYALVAFLLWSLGRSLGFNPDGSKCVCGPNTLYVVSAVNPTDGQEPSPRAILTLVCLFALFMYLMYVSFRKNAVDNLCVPGGCHV